MKAHILGRASGLINLSIRLYSTPCLKAQILKTITAPNARISGRLNCKSEIATAKATAPTVLLSDEKYLIVTISSCVLNMTPLIQNPRQ